MSKKYIVLVCCAIAVPVYSAEQKDSVQELARLKRSPEGAFADVKSAKQLLAPMSLGITSKSLENGSPKSSPTQIPAVDYLGKPMRNRLSPRERDLIARCENWAQIQEGDDTREAANNPLYRNYNDVCDDDPVESESGSEGAFHPIDYSG